MLIRFLALALALSSPSVFAQTIRPTTPPKPATSSTAAPPSPNLLASIEELKKRIEALQKQVSDLEESLKITDRGVYGDSKENIVGLVARVNELETEYNYVELRPSSPKKYSRLETPSGTLLISLEDTTPYLDGFKVKLAIGNPMNATLVGFKMNVDWGPEWDPKSPNFAKWKSEHQDKEYSFTEALSSGAWTPVELVFPKTTSNQMGLITVTSVVTNTVRLDR